MPLVASGTLGSLAYTGTGNGNIGTTSDSDAFTISLDAGQAVSLLMSPAATLRGSINLSGPGGVNQTASASTNGATVVMQPVTAAKPARTQSR